MIIGEERPKDVKDKILAREVVLEKTPDGKELLKITVKCCVPEGQEGSPKTRVGQLLRHDRSDRFIQPVRLKADQGHSSPSAQKWVLGR